MTEEKLGKMGSIKENVSFTAVSGFDKNLVILGGRSYSGCAICGSLQYLLMLYLYLVHSRPQLQLLSIILLIVVNEADTRLVRTNQAIEGEVHILTLSFD